MEQVEEKTIKVKTLLKFAPAIIGVVFTLGGLSVVNIQLKNEFAILKHNQFRMGKALYKKGFIDFMPVVDNYGAVFYSSSDFLASKEEKKDSDETKRRACIHEQFALTKNEDIEDIIAE